MEQQQWGQNPRAFASSHWILSGSDSEPLASVPDSTETVTLTIQLLPRTWNSLRIICKEYTEDSQWRNSTTQLIKAYKQISMLPSQVPMLFTAGQFWPSKCLFLFVTHLKNKRLNPGLHRRRFSTLDWQRERLCSSAASLRILLVLLLTAWPRTNCLDSLNFSCLTYKI